MSRCAVFIIALGLVSVETAIYSNKLISRVASTKRDEFFGYSVALQQSSPPRVVIGAPMAVHGQNKVGSVYVCSFIGADETSDKNCKSYTINEQHIASIRDTSFKDNMFGACLDGGTNHNDDVLIGAPKLTEIGQEINYIIGGVFRLSDIEKNTFRRFPSEDRHSQYTKDSEYYYGQAQFGFSMHVVNSSESLYGTPGFHHWRGEAFLTSPSDGSIVPEARRLPIRHKRSVEERSRPLMYIEKTNKDSSLAGYAVTAGRFFGHTSYAVGLPNGNIMMGEVKLYSQDNAMNKILEERVSWPSFELQMAEHFGSTLMAADVNGDGYDDLLVGAPNANQGDDYDNGKVYVFVSNGHDGFEHHQTLIGKPRSRCGTSISNLGKITLDQYDSIAIGCPYEDNGKGAVKVYVWVDSKLIMDSSVSVDMFTSFGYSLSRAVDVDSNNVADLAVGAYRSDSVIIIKAKSVFYYKMKLTYNTLYSDRDDNDLRIEICINTVGISNTITTVVSLQFDDRIKRSYIPTNETISISKTGYCKKHQLKLNPYVQRLDPLAITMMLQESTCDTCAVRSPTFPNILREKIPFNYNCKGDVCIPVINIVSNIDTEIVVGAKDKHPLEVMVSNTGDPAFVCTIDVLPTPAIPIAPVNPKRCEGSTCEFNHIIKNVVQAYTLDFRGWSAPGWRDRLDLAITAKCVNVTIEHMVAIKLKYVSNLVVEGPELTKQYDSLNGSTYDVEGAAIFHVMNEGPSNLQSANYIIRIPRYSHDLQIVDVYQPEKDHSCEPIDEAFDERIEYKYNETDFESSPAAAGFGKAANLENMVFCGHPRVRCMEIRCGVRDLAKDSTRVIKIPTRINIEEILNNYRSTFSIVSTITREGEDKKYTSELDIIDRQTITESINVWYIIGSIVGALLVLAIVSFVLYKLNFFNRPKHELLKEQQETEGTLEEVEMRRPAVDEADTETSGIEEEKLKN